MIIDTHAHLTDDAFTADIERFIEEANAAGVGGMLCVGTTLESSQCAVALAERFPQVRAAVGLHPNNCCQAAAGHWDAIVQLSQHPRVAALGETGLDKYWDDCPWEVQVDYFRRHLQLSRDTELPVVIHTRECAAETLEILQQEALLGPIRGVMHSFTGPLDLTAGFLEIGLYISFAGMVTFKNAIEIQQIAKTIPGDRLLVETDSPYLSPVPHRGQRPNRPAWVRHTLEFVAELRGTSIPDLAKQTTNNAERLFGPWTA